MTPVEAHTEPLSDLCEPFDDASLPPLDRADTGLPVLTAAQRHWRDDGFVILPRFVPDDLIDAYCAAWLREHAHPIQVAEQTEPLRFIVDPADAHGWDYCTPYMHVPELRALVCERRLADMLEHLIGEPMGVHLNLTGWVSTRRDFHQDGYLNPDHVADWYAAVWIALDDVALDSGPFEYVPGSHRWPTIRQARMLAAMGEPPGGFDANWPSRSEAVLTPIFEERLASENITPARFIAKRGDVLIWHARLLHRGSVPSNPDAERRALIAHYSGVNHRPEMAAPMQDTAGGWFFPIRERHPV